MYQDGELTLDGLVKKAPLIAAAVRQGIRPRLISSDPARKSSIVSIG
jgi:hypothetical protein